MSAVDLSWTSQSNSRPDCVIAYYSAISDRMVAHKLQLSAVNIVAPKFK